MRIRTLALLLAPVVTAVLAAVVLLGTTEAAQAVTYVAGCTAA